MFGQKGFGQSSFGQTGAFGSTTPFGSANTSSTFAAKGGTGFGTTGGFGGQPAASTGLFGSTNTATSSAGGLFGGAGTTNTFGQAPQSTGFNFGGQQAQPQNQTGGLFGGASAGSSIFGTPTTSSAFGAKTPGGFGATNTPGGGLFGSTQPAGGGLFGSTNTNAANINTGGMSFGGGAAVSGTTIKFNPPMGTDTVMKNGVSQNMSTRHQCITAMKEYETRSLEELRMDDYTANRKGPQQGAAGTMFGGTQPQATAGFGGFGANQNQNKTTGFGGFGAATGTSTAGGLFGTNQQQNTSLFGAQQNKPLFGGTQTQTSTATTGFGGFGNNTANTSLFGQNQPKPGGMFGTATSQAGTGLFGGTNTQSTGFGTGTTTGFGGFGQTQPAQTGGLFGAAKPAFGTATTSAGGIGFGQQNTGSLFAKPATSTAGFPFGQNTTGFGQQQAQGGLFGAKPGGGFGTGTSTLGGTTGFGTGLGTSTLGGTGSLFSGTQNKPTLGTGLGTGFGGTSTMFGGLSGTGTNTALNLSGANTTLGTSSDSATLAAQQAQLQQQIMVLANSPYGDSPLFKNLKQDDNRRDETLKPTNPAAQKAALATNSQYKVSPRPVAKIKPKPIQSIVNGKSQLFEGLEDDDSSFGNGTLVPRKSIKKLVIKNTNKSPSHLHASPNRSRAQMDEDLVVPSPIHPAFPDNSPDKANTTVNGETNDVIVGSKSMTPNVETPKSGAANLDDTLAVFRRKGLGRDDSLDTSVLPVDQDATPPPPHPTRIVLTRPGYFTEPTLDELVTLMDADGNVFVENFVVGREGYGNVFFPGETNVAGLNLDEIVHFRRKEITVYPDDNNKPIEGTQLNKTAQVTLDCVWPNDKSNQSPIKDTDRLRLMNYQDRIEKATARIGAKFIDYRPETGSWVFEVKHFSKYGLVDDSDEEDDGGVKDPQQLKLLREKQQQQLAIQRKQINLVEAQKQEQSASQQPQQMAPPSVGLQPPGGDDSDMGDDDSCQMEPRETCSMGDDEDDVMKEQFPQYGQDMDDEDEDVVPSSHRLATKLGVDAHQVQVMKASFFADDDDMDTVEKPVQAVGLGGMRSQADPMASRSVFSSSFHQPSSANTSPRSSTSPLKRAFLHSRVQQQQQQQQTGVATGRPLPMSRSMMLSAPEHIVLPSGMTQLDRPRKVVGSRIQRTVPPLSKSLLHDKEKMLMDQGLFCSRACRVGWGPGLTMVHCGTPVTEAQDSPVKQGLRPSILSSRPQKKKRIDASPYEVHLEKVNVNHSTAANDVLFKNCIEGALEVQLEYSKSTTDTGCPLFVPQLGIDCLHRHAERAEHDLQRLGGHPDADHAHEAHLVWELSVALWGQLPEFPDGDELDRNSYAYHIARREAFSRWLTSAASRKIKKEVQNIKFKGQSHIGSILSYLTGRQISEACFLAQENGDHRLALLLAQATGCNTARQIVAKQLSNWEEQRADQFIDSERLKVYSLLAGIMVWPSSAGEVNTCEDLDWKRCLAIHLWYLCTPSATIAEALKNYDAAFKGSSEFGKYSVVPLPPYLEDSIEGCDVSQGEAGDADRFVVQDMCYHLLQLYSNRSHRLDRLLAPTTVTHNHLDFRLSWLMWQTLQSLEYSHLSEYQAASLCTGFAAQLEGLGLWQWAVFVLLHIQDHTSREHAVRNLLERHLGLYRDEEYLRREEFLLDQLYIPAAWIHEAKARRAHYEKRAHEEAWHLLKAGHWNTSHITLLRHVAADAIVNENYDYLKKYLREMSAVEYSSSIQDWDVGGKVFLDYITMVEALHEIKKGDVSAYELEKLEPEVTSLCDRIGNLKCFTAKDRLCQCEMAKRTANLLRTLLMLKSDSTHPQHAKHVPTKLLAPHLSKLPMPEDYALQELRDLTRSYMLEMTSA